MAIKAVCTITGVHRDADTHTHFTATVNYAGLVDASILGSTTIVDLDPSLAGSTLTGQIEGAMKTFLTGEGITFGLLDSVRLLPGLI